MSEAQVARDVDEYLERSGWMVVKFSQDKATRAQLAGVPDRIAVRRGVTCFIELKRPGGKRRVSQAQFAEAIRPHLWSTVIYCMAQSLDDVMTAIGDTLATTTPPDR